MSIEYHTMKSKSNATRIHRYVLRSVEPWCFSWTHYPLSLSVVLTLFGYSSSLWIKALVLIKSNAQTRESRSVGRLCICVNAWYEKKRTDDANQKGGKTKTKSKLNNTRQWLRPNTYIHRNNISNVVKVLYKTNILGEKNNVLSALKRNCWKDTRTLCTLWLRFFSRSLYPILSSIYLILA